MEEKETMVQIDNVSKVYRLGEIGGTTLVETFQRLKAKVLRREDPTKKIGSKNYNKGEKFLALDGINLTIKKGERVGIIGHNGAGKSTLLKLICRVTAPTSGEIGLNGRITSMLEVGTGFHPELTGRENIYMNGAILGMTRREINEVIEDIIDFSEVREFIDTPVKRYSSGMYVKLAFSVAAHLKSEIMIMDEVLAVGDMAFQKKCLEKMKSVSESDGRTILYVSHNMNTIRQLCERVVVLNQGHIVYDGDVENGILDYLNISSTKDVCFNLASSQRNYEWCTGYIKMKKCILLSNTNDYSFGSDIVFKLFYLNEVKMNNVIFRFTIFRLNGFPVCTQFLNKKILDIGMYEETFTIETHNLVPDKYYLRIVILQTESSSLRFNHDYVEHACYFNIILDSNNSLLSSWPTHLCGNIVEKLSDNKYEK